MKKNINTVNTLSINQRIESIKLNKFFLSLIKEEDKEKIDVKKITFEFGIKFKFDIESDKVALSLILTTKFFADKQKTFLLGEMESEGLFHILNPTEVLIGGKELPIPALTLFTGALLATSRGFYILSVQNTCLEGSIFPIIDSAQFFKTLVE